MPDRTFARVAYKQSFLSLTIWDCKVSTLFIVSKLCRKYFQENEADSLPDSLSTSHKVSLCRLFLLSINVNLTKNAAVGSKFAYM